jgi:MFS family permease
MIGYFIAYGTVDIPSSLSWRLPLAIQAAIAAFGAGASHFYLPASPRWLAHKGRKEEASAAWDLLGVSAAEREKDLLENPVLNEMNELNETPAVQAIAKDREFTTRLKRNSMKYAAMFGKDSRKQMFLGVFMMSMQQLSGIDGVLYVRISPLHIISR